MLFLVARKDLVNAQYKSTGEWYPWIVDAADAQSAVLASFDRYMPQHVPKDFRQYIVVPMAKTTIVTITPRKDFTISSETFCTHKHLSDRSFGDY
jgi:hypothetical protein